MPYQKAIKLRLSAANCIDDIGAEQFLDPERPSRLAFRIEYGGFTEQAL